MKGKVFISAAFSNKVLSLLEVTTKFSEFIFKLYSFDNRFERILFSKKKGEEIIDLSEFNSIEDLALKVADLIIANKKNEILKEEGENIDYDYKRRIGFLFTILTHGTTDDNGNWMYFTLGGDGGGESYGGEISYYFDEKFVAPYKYYQSLVEIIIETFDPELVCFCPRVYLMKNKFFPVPIEHGRFIIGFINYFKNGFELPHLPEYVDLENYKDKGIIFHIDRHVMLPLYTSFADYEAGKCPQFYTFTEKILPVFEAFKQKYPRRKRL